jgi:hypothetical protein
MMQPWILAKSGMGETRVGLILIFSPYDKNDRQDRSLRAIADELRIERRCSGLNDLYGNSKAALAKVDKKPQAVGLLPFSMLQI